MNWVRTVRFAHVALPVYIGLCYLLGSSTRYQGPVFLHATVLAPIWVWGVVFISLGALNWFAFTYKGQTPNATRSLKVFSIWALGTMYIFWALIYGYTAVNDSISFVGVGLYAFAAAIEYAALERL